jgi:stalled ribosome rescue protein Dom34
MKKLGIWLDKKKARLISLENEKEVMNTIVSEVEDFHIQGGSGTKFKGGPQDVVQDSKYLEREKHQLKAYFKEIASKMKDANAVVIFGPAQTKEKLRKELQENYKEINAKVKAVKTADNMTDNQVKALVRDFFN